MDQNTANWDEIRKFAISSDRPPEWPPGVRAISMNGMALFGIHEASQELYWNGHKLVTEKRFSRFERSLAVAGLLIALIGVTASGVQAYAAWVSIPPTTLPAAGL